MRRLRILMLAIVFVLMPIAAYLGRDWYVKSVAERKLLREWSEIHKYLIIEKGRVRWTFATPAEAIKLSELRRLSAITDLNGRIIERSSMFGAVGLTSNNRQCLSDEAPQRRGDVRLHRTKNSR